MARQYVDIGFPNPNFINETGTNDYILPGVYVNETSPSGAQPVGQTDWPNPRGPSRSVSLLTWVVAGQITAAITATPFSQTDWPTPRGPAPAISLRTWIQSVSPAQNAATPVVKTFDYPNPRASTGSADLRTWVQPSVRLAVVIYPATFGNFDWPVPKAAARSIDLITWTQSQGLSTQAAAPVVSTFDWLNPRAAVGSIGLRTWLNSGITAAVPASFGQFDWPNPRGATRSIELLTWKQSLGLPAQFASPIVSTFDWPNPRGPIGSADLRTWLQPGIATIVPAAFGQFDWPVPRAATRSIDLISWLQGPGPGAKASLIIGARNYDWQNPRGTIGSISLLSWFNGLDLSLITAPIVFPATFGQRDWPVPRGAVRGAITIYAPPTRNINIVPPGPPTPIPIAARAIISISSGSSMAIAQDPLQPYTLIKPPTSVVRGDVVTWTAYFLNPNNLQVAPTLVMLTINYIAQNMQRAETTTAMVYRSGFWYAQWDSGVSPVSRVGTIFWTIQSTSPSTTSVGRLELFNSIASLFANI